MNTKKLIAIALTLILVFSLASCNSGDSKDDSNNDEVQDTVVVEEKPIVEDEDEDKDIEDPEPELQVLIPGPLTADFFTLLANRNFYVKYELTFEFPTDPEGNIEIKPDQYGQWVRFERAMKDDDLAFIHWFSHDAANIPTQHKVYMDFKEYSINHDIKTIGVYDNTPSELNWWNDFFDVSRMYYIESGISSVNGKQMPYESYGTQNKQSIYRLYVDGDKVMYWLLIRDNEIIDIRTFLEISQDIPSHMFELPKDYPLIEED